MVHQERGKVATPNVVNSPLLHQSGSHETPTLYPGLFLRQSCHHGLLFPVCHLLYFSRPSCSSVCCMRPASYRPGLGESQLYWLLLDGSAKGIGGRKLDAPTQEAAEYLSFPSLFRSISAREIQALGGTTFTHR